MNDLCEITEECSVCGNKDDYRTKYPPKLGDYSGFCRYCRELMVVKKVVKV